MLSIHYDSIVCTNLYSKLSRYRGITNCSDYRYSTDAKRLLDELKTKNPHIQINHFQCDVSSKDDLRSTFDKIASAFRKSDILINAAGIFNDNHVECTFKVDVVRIMSFCFSILKF